MTLFKIRDKYYIFLLISIFCFIPLTNYVYALKQSTKHPKLILTETRLSELEQSIINTKKDLWESVKVSADNFIMNEFPYHIKPTNEFRYIGERLPALALTYLLTKDDKYYNNSLKWIEALLSIRNWGNEDGNLLRAAWCIGLVIEYDWLYDYLDEELKGKIENRLLYEGAIIKNTAAKYRALSNHLLIETTTLGIIGLVLSEKKEDAKHYLNQADEWTNYIINYAPTDGAWGEGILYWQYGLRYFLIFLESAETTGYKNYFENYDWLKQTGYFPIYFSLPTEKTQVVNFSDSPSEVNIPPFILYLLASKYKNGYFQFWGNKLRASGGERYSWMDLIEYDRNITSKNINALPTLHHFRDMGFVMMRSDWGKNATVIGFRCGPAAGNRNQSSPLRLKYHGFGPGHAHPDINSFSIFSEGEWLAIDPGYTYLKETRNHNTVIVNNFGQAGSNGKWLDYLEFESREPAPEILMVESNNIYDYVIGDAGNIYVDQAELTSFRRHLLFLKPNILVVADELEAKEDSDFEWLINAKETITQIDSIQFIIRKNRARLGLKLFSPSKAEASVEERYLRASDLKNELDTGYATLKTLKFKMKDRKTLFYLVVLYMPDEYSELPKIVNEPDRIIINTENKTWLINYTRDKESSKFPLLKVENCNPMKPYYYFSSETEKN